MAHITKVWSTKTRRSALRLRAALGRLQWPTSLTYNDRHDRPHAKRRFRPTPSWLIFGLLVVEGLLWLSERYRWFWFNEQKGWTVLIGVAAVGVAIAIMLGWFVVSLLFRWWFQFSIRSLLVLTIAIALPCSWLAVEMFAPLTNGKTAVF